MRQLIVRMTLLPLLVLLAPDPATGESYECSATGTYALCNDDPFAGTRTCYDHTYTARGFGSSEGLASSSALSSCSSHITMMIISNGSAGGGHENSPCSIDSCSTVGPVLPESGPSPTDYSTQGVPKHEPSKAPPPFAADPSGQTTLLVPASWTVYSLQKGDLYFLSIQENPHALSGATLGMFTGSLATGASPQALLFALENTLSSALVQRRQQLPDGTLRLEIQGFFNSTLVRIVGTAWNDGTNAFACFFRAALARFDELGGQEMLEAWLRANQQRTSDAPPR